MFPQHQQNRNITGISFLRHVIICVLSTIFSEFSYLLNWLIYCTSRKKCRDSCGLCHSSTFACLSRNFKAPSENQLLWYVNLRFGKQQDFLTRKMKMKQLLEWLPQTKQFPPLHAIWTFEREQVEYIQHCTHEPFPVPVPFKRTKNPDEQDALEQLEHQYHALSQPPLVKHAEWTQLTVLLMVRICFAIHI